MRCLAIMLACGSLLSVSSACYIEDCNAEPLPLKGIYNLATQFSREEEPGQIEQALMNIGADEVTVKYTRNGKRWHATYAIRARDERGL